MVTTGIAGGPSLQEIRDSVSTTDNTSPTERDGASDSSKDDGSDSTVTFDTSRQTLSTRTFGTTGTSGGSLSDGGDSDPKSGGTTVNVTRSDTSGTTSSVAGGSGLLPSASRFTGINQSDLSTVGEGATVEVVNQASDIITAVDAETDGDTLFNLPSALERLEANPGQVDDVVTTIAGNDIREAQRDFRQVAQRQVDLPGGGSAPLLAVAGAVAVGVAYLAGRR